MDKHLAQQVFQCGKCQWVWSDEYELPMPMEAWLARLNGNLICPNCGFKPRHHGRGDQIMLLLGDKHEAGLKVVAARRAAQ